MATPLPPQVPQIGGSWLPPPPSLPPRQQVGNLDLFWPTLIIVVILSVIGTVVGYFLNALDIGLMILLAGLVYITLSFDKVIQDEWGVLVLFGKPIEALDYGLVFTPLWITSVIKVTRLDMVDVLPAPDDKIYTGDKEVPDGKVLPIRITFGPPDEKNGIPGDNPYNKQMNAIVKPTITWRICDPICFVTTLGTTENARRQMNAAAVAMFNASFSKHTPQVIQREMEIHSANLEQAIDRALANKGVDILAAFIEPIGYSHDLNRSVTKVGEAEQEAKQVGIRAEAEKKRLTREGEGKAAARKSLLEAEAAGAEALANKLRGNPEALEALRLEKITDAVGQSKPTIISLDGLASALLNMFKRP